MNEPILLPRDIAHDARDWSDLQRAVALLEAPTLTARMANLVGTPLEFAVKVLPSSVSNRIHGAVQAALSKSAQAALWSMDNSPGKERRPAGTNWRQPPPVRSAVPSALLPCSSSCRCRPRS